jgi:hypothetical protein
LRGEVRACPERSRTGEGEKKILLYPPLQKEDEQFVKMISSPFEKGRVRRILGRDKNIILESVTEADRIGCDLPGRGEKISKGTR